MTTVEIQGVGRYQLPSDKIKDLLQWLLANNATLKREGFDPAAATLLNEQSS